MSGGGRDGPTAGFSLIEVLVVLAILALAAVIGVPSIRNIVPSQRLTAVTEAIVGEIGMLRTEALRTGQVTRLAFDPGSARFVSSRRGAPALSTAGWHTLVEPGIGSRAAPGEIRFLPDGGCTGGRITLAGPGGTRILDVIRATGAIRRAAAVP